MSGTGISTAAARQSEILTPTLRASGRRSAFWIASGGFVLLVALAWIAMSGSGTGGPPLSATNPAPAGAQALVRVLANEGVDVVAPESLEEAVIAAGEVASSRTTIAVYDPNAFLNATQWDTVLTLAETIILIDPSLLALDTIAPDIAAAGAVNGAVSPECDFSPPLEAQQITGDGAGFRVISTASAHSCYPSGDDIFSLVSIERVDGGSISVIGATDALSNEFIADRSNAALALTLFGQTDRLIWYLPSIDDVPVTGEPSLGELTPDWVIPTLLLLVLVFVAAAIWRGRRFGPLVVENLPVTVRASETMEGRARLYATASARLRAIDALRVGTIERVARDCGLSRLSTVDEVIFAAASVAGIATDSLRRVFVDAVPETDHQMVALSDELARLEVAVRAATKPSD